MRKTGRYEAPRESSKGKWAVVLIVIACILTISAVAALCVLRTAIGDSDATTATTETLGTWATTEAPTEKTTEPIPVETVDPTAHWETGFVASVGTLADYYDAYGTPAGRVLRGTELKYEIGSDGKTWILVHDTIGYLEDSAGIVTDMADSVREQTLYVRTTVNLRDVEGKLLETLAEKGSALSVIGCDYVDETGEAHMYRVTCGEQEGYVMPWYVTGSEEEALANYDDGSYAIHEGRGNRYGGGGAANLDYYPREKGEIPGNPMPEECRTLYLVTWCLSNVDAYIALADQCGINAFVVDIVDGGSVGYASDVMREYCPTGASAAKNTVEEYQTAIQKLKDAGYYVIGRITTFNDAYFVQDHPEYAITSPNGAPLRLNATYWPSPYNRTAWQYKVDLAVEAVELMGFHEIQFDYVRFPDNTSKYEKAGTVDFHNTYGETKAQAIQRFLMYAADILHEHGAYVSADVFGESAFTYVTAYGQYWPAISNVVDVISGMPYPDHFGAEGSWKPWEHPYEILNSWGKSVVSRQKETATPAAVRTWIQAYNAIRPPYNVYGPDQVYAQIRGLRDAGCTGGYMTWNAGADLNKYRSLMPAFTPPDDE